MKVKLDDVIEAIALCNDEVTYYYSITHEVVGIYDDGEFMGNNFQIEIDEDEFEESDDFIALPDSFDIHEYSIMESFVNSLEDIRCYHALNQAIRGKGAFRRFKATLIDMDLQSEWYAFRDKAYERIAREWCERHGIEISN